jgi:hypothetical protein
MGYRLAGDLIADLQREILIQFIVNEDGQKIELIEDSPGSNSKLIGNILSARSGCYHLAYETVDIKEKAIELGFRRIGKCEPAVAFQDRHVAFFVGRDGAIFEFISTRLNCNNH